MLFALQSMAKRMSPVLSSYVTPHKHKPGTRQSKGGDVDAQGDTCIICALIMYKSCVSCA